MNISGVIYEPYTALSYSNGGVAQSQTIAVDTLKMTDGNLSKPVTSSFFTGDQRGSLSDAVILGVRILGVRIDGDRRQKYHCDFRGPNPGIGTSANGEQKLLFVGYCADV